MKRYSYAFRQGFTVSETVKVGIRSVGEKIYARLIVNNDEKLNIDTVLDEKGTNVEEVAHSEKLDELLSE